MDRSRPKAFWFTTETLSGQAWDGFRPVAYWLDPEQVGKLSLERAAEGETEGVSVSVVDAYTELRDAGATVDDGFLSLAFGLHAEIGSRKVTFSGPPFSIELLAVLLRLHKAGANGFAARWFWYDYNECEEEPQHSYRFFVVCDDKIVADEVSLSDWPRNGFDPAVFSTGSKYPALWRNDKYWDQAVANFWYQKFYSETKIGRLMALRPDEPDLFCYPKPPAFADAQARVNWWGFGATVVAGAACIYFWSRSLWAGVAGLIFLVLAWPIPAHLIGDLLYEMRISTYTLQRALLETRLGNLDRDGRGR